MPVLRSTSVFEDPNGHLMYDARGKAGRKPIIRLSSLCALAFILLVSVMMFSMSKLVFADASTSVGVRGSIQPNVNTADLNPNTSQNASVY